MKKFLTGILFLLSSVAAFAQTSVTIPSQTYTANFTFNGQSGVLTIVQPAQTITIPASGSALPAGFSVSGTGSSAILTYTGNLTVNGNIVADGTLTGTELSLTSGPTLPASSNGLYVLQASGTPAVLSPVPLATPVITFSQAPSPVNTFNLVATP
jgi:hypothetical protein